MSILGTYPNASVAAQTLGIYESEAAKIASIHFIFNHFSKQKPDSAPLRRMQHAFNATIAHAATRISLIDGYEPAFFSANEYYSHDAITIATLCSPFLKKDSGIKDFGTSKVPPRITGDIVRHAYLLQKDAIEIKETADLDHKGPRADNDCFSKEAYFLAWVNLFEKMYHVENSDVSYESLSDHLRYDLICASRYVNHSTAFGSIVADAVDTMKDKILEQLKLSPCVHLDIRKDDGPKLDFR